MELDVAKTMEEGLGGITGGGGGGGGGDGGGWGLGRGHDCGDWPWCCSPRLFD